MWRVYVLISDSGFSFLFSFANLTSSHTTFMIYMTLWTFDFYVSLSLLFDLHHLYTYIHIFHDPLTRTWTLEQL